MAWLNYPHLKILSISITVWLSLKTLSLKKYEDRRLREGHLWIYSNEVDTAKTPLKTLTAGEQVFIEDFAGKKLGIATVSPNSLICARLISRD